jgi:hypothetical protein
MIKFFFKSHLALEKPLTNSTILLKGTKEDFLKECRKIKLIKFNIL